MGDVTQLQLATVLGEGEILACEPLLWGSNYTFLLRIGGGGGEHLAVYKPRRGERHLWDFPPGTLYLREYASFLVSEALGWGLVPATALRDGPHGVGSVQLFVEHDAGENYFTLRQTHREELKAMALFDCLTNNADRKGGHCIRDREGRIWGIDHGLTFNAVPKLRTVIWDYVGEPIPPKILADVEGLLGDLVRQGGIFNELSGLLATDEIDALISRGERLLELGVFPPPGPRRSVPWPLV